MKRNRILVILIGFLLVACMLISPVRRATVVPTPPPPLAEATPTALPLATQIIPIPPQNTTPFPGFPTDGTPLKEHYTKIGESDHFEYYQDRGYEPVEQTQWIEQAETVYAYVSHRLNLDAAEKIGLAFNRPDTSACPIRGAAAGTFIIIYADEKTSEKQILGVLAHELGHAIRSSAAEDLKPSSIALEEGTATWASGSYWTDWQGYASIDDMVKDYLRQSTYLPITDYSNLEGSQPGSTIQGDCLTRRNILYTEWASFIDFLLRQYGRDKLNALYQSGSNERSKTETIIQPPDYPGIYGHALNQLEAQWLASLQ